ncbi:MAG: hypothetical protein ACP5OS_06820, partial [Leptospirillia bacterium]
PRSDVFESVYEQEVSPDRTFPGLFSSHPKEWSRHFRLGGPLMEARNNWASLSRFISVRLERDRRTRCPRRENQNDHAFSEGE